MSIDDVADLNDAHNCHFDCMNAPQVDEEQLAAFMEKDV